MLQLKISKLKREFTVTPFTSFTHKQTRSCVLADDMNNMELQRALWESEHWNTENNRLASFYNTEL